MKPISEYLSDETKEIFGKGKFHFSGGDFYKLFRLREEELIKGTDSILSPIERLQYLKCYAVAVGSIINKWYKKPDSAIDEDFQVEFFQSGTAYLSRYYEANPQDRFFNQFPNPPKTKEEEKSIANWLIHKAEWYIKSASNTWLRKLYEEKCIDYDAYQKARSEARANGISIEEIELSDFQDQNCWKAALHEDHGELLEIVPSKLNDDYFQQIEGFIDSIDENEEYKDDLDSLVNRLRLSYSGRIRKLYSFFNINDITQIQSNTMWEVRISTLKVDEMMLIFQAMDYGYGPTTEGKQLLLMQYLLLAVAHLSKYESFTIDENVTIHSPEQMVFLATVIGQTYTFFNNKYEEQIIKPISRINPKNKAEKDRLPTIRKENFIRIISDYIEENINSRFQEYQTKKATLNLFTQTSDSSVNYMDFILDLEKVFGNHEAFNLFCNKLVIQQSNSALFGNDDFIKMFGKMATTQDIKRIIKAIITALGYEILKDDETEATLYYEGRGGKFKNQRNIDLEKKKLKFGLSIETESIPQFQKVIDQYNTQRQAKVMAPTIISTVGFESKKLDIHSEDEALRKYSRCGKIDLLKLASIIRENYHLLPDSEKERIQNLIETLVTDF